jgi:hypothetical protein
MRMVFNWLVTGFADSRVGKPLSSPNLAWRYRGVLRELFPKPRSAFRRSRAQLQARDRISHDRRLCLSGVS